MSITYRSDPDIIWDLYSSVRGVVAYDIGANAGMVSRLLAPNFELVVAMEPCIESFLELDRDHPDNVEVICAAAGGMDGVVALREATEAIKLGQLVTGDAMDLWGETVRRRVVPCLTLNSLVEFYSEPDFIKIDTEGHELPIVEGALALLRNTPQVIIECHDRWSGETIHNLLPSMFRKVYHPGYAPDEWGATNHYYLTNIA